VGDRSRSLPKIIPAGVSFQLGKTSARDAESESARGIEFARGAESESDSRGVESESALGIEFARGAESESDRRGVESESARGIEFA